jgi:hypothetical protein
MALPKEVCAHHLDVRYSGEELTEGETGVRISWDKEIFRILGQHISGIYSRPEAEIATRHNVLENRLTKTSPLDPAYQQTKQELSDTNAQLPAELQDNRHH